MLLPLAQALDSAVPQEKDPTKVLIWSGIALLVVLILLVSVAAIRKKYFPKEEKAADATPAGFGVNQLKELYDQGLLSDDEFNAAKAKIVAESHAAFMAQGKAKAANAKK